MGSKLKRRRVVINAESSDEEYEEYDEKENVMPKLRMASKRKRVLIKAENSDEEYEEYDGKENVMPQQGQQQIQEPIKPEPTKIVEDEGDNNIIQLSHYWPYGSGSNNQNTLQDTSLLYLRSFDVPTRYASCANCPNGLNEMIPLFKYSQGNNSKYALFEDHPKELRKFESEVDAKTGHKIKVSVVLRTSGCSSKNECSSYFTLSRSPFIKIFRYENRFSFYLKIDESTIPLIPKIIKYDNFYPCLLKRYGNGELGGPVEPMRNGLSDTFDFPEAIIPIGFKLNLRDYQKRSISWMKSIEAIEPKESNTILHDLLLDDKDSPIIFKLGETPYHLTNSSLETESSVTTKIGIREPLRFYGGILADDTGSGKTVTILGLIHSAPFTQEQQNKRAQRFKKDINFSIQSRASCIVCPSNIYKQWLQEAKKCNPKFKVYGLSNIYDHQKVSWKDLVEADLVIVSYQFLANSNYSEIGTGYSSAENEWNDFPETKGRVLLHYLHFHRIIFDEFHELSASKKSILSIVESLEGDYYWGLTGTPTNDPLEDMKYLAPNQRFHDVYNKNSNARREITRKHVKRNVPDLELPEIQNETVWIDLSAHELNLMRWKNQKSTSVKEQIMMCSHYQLSETGSVQVEEFVPVEVAQKRLSEGKEAEINNLKCRLIQQKAHIQSLLEKDPRSSVEHLKTSLQATETQLQSVQSSFNYFQSVFKVIGEPDKNECRICFGNIEEESLSILPCSHLFCYNCISPFILKAHACPLCRQSVPKISDIFRIRIHKAEKLTVKSETLDTSKYSSKLIGLYRYITELIETDKNARVILFLQYRDLADFIAKSFKELNVECVRVVGTVFQRQNAIAKFRDSADIRLIMMSSEDSVSGINLTQATHVILLHPFYTGQGELVDLAYEKQGISRAYRFGLDHPLKIVRFAVRGTIEEEITIRRQKSI